MADSWEWLNKKHWVGTAGVNLHLWDFGFGFVIESGWKSLSIGFGPFWASIEWFRDE